MINLISKVAAYYTDSLKLFRDKDKSEGLYHLALCQVCTSELTDLSFVSIWENRVNILWHIQLHKNGFRVALITCKQNKQRKGQ